MFQPPVRLVRPEHRTKRRRKCESGPLWVAMRAPPDSAHFYIVGFCQFERVELFDPPTSMELACMERMRLHWEVDLPEYSFPVAAVVKSCGWLDRPIPVAQGRGGSVSTLSIDLQDAVRGATVVGAEPGFLETLGDIGSWKLWKSESVWPRVEEALKARDPFRWPLFPSVARALGFVVPEDPALEHPCDAGGEVEADGGHTR